MYEKIKELLPCFGYSGEALELFNKKIEENDIAPAYKKLMDENGRFITKIEIRNREDLDEGWKLFKSIFKSFCIKFEVDYLNFFSNNILISKQTKKLFKTCKEYYNNEVSKLTNFNGTIEEAFEIISAMSLPKKELYMVLSVNLEDFILCSTKNPWTSCLNIENGDFWSSLSGLFLDKNRAMLYVSDLSEKEYLGIKSLVMFNRSWVLLDSNEDFNVNISYPTKANVNIDIVSKILCHPVKSLQEDFISRYEIKPILNDNKVFPFGFQDGTEFLTDGKTFRIKGSTKSGCYDIVKSFNNSYSIDRHDNIYYVSNKLKIGKSIAETFIVECEICGKKESSNIFVNNTFLCKDCFGNEKLVCSVCGKPYKKKFLTTDNEIICEKCKAEDDYIKCKKCGRHFVSYGDELCEECSTSIALIKCDMCGEYKNIIDLTKTLYRPIEKRVMIPFNNNGKVCDSCFEKFILNMKKEIIFCENCGQYYEKGTEETCRICGV